MSAETPARRPTTAVYPGSFDPVTNGHLDLVDRAARLFDRVIVAILMNAAKEPLFGLEERREMLVEATRGRDNVSIDLFDGLLVSYAERMGAQVIVRGVRAVSDFEFEFQMALMNRRLNGAIETVFMMPADAYAYLSSRLVKEVSALGGSVTGLVPPGVEKRLARAFAAESR